MAQRLLERRVFLLTFASTFFLFSLLAALAVLWLNPRVETPAQLPSQVEASGYLPSKEESITLLLVLREQDGTSPHSYLLIGFEPLSGRIPVLALPPQLALGASSTLEEVYLQKGITQTAEELSTLFSMAVERTATMDKTGLLTALDQLGQSEYELPYRVAITGYGNTAIVEPGLQLLDGKRSLDLITYTGYPGGESTRLEVSSGVGAAILNQKLSLVLTGQSEALFSRLINAMTTNITAADYVDHLQAAQFMARLQVRPATAVPFLGEAQEDGRFLPDEDTQSLINKLFHG